MHSDGLPEKQMLIYKLVAQISTKILTDKKHIGLITDRQTDVHIWNFLSGKQIGLYKKQTNTTIFILDSKAAATLGGIARGNDRGIASVVWQVTLKYMGALIGR